MKPAIGRLAALVAPLAAALFASTGCGGTSELEYYSGGAGRGGGSAGEGPSSGGRAGGGKGGTSGTGGTAIAGTGNAPSGGTGGGGTGGGGTGGGGTGGGVAGTGGTPGECDEHADCPPDNFCQNGACALDVCTGGTVVCDGNVLLRCRDEGDGQDSESCLERQTCVGDGNAAYCGDWLCTPGTIECDLAAERIVVCSDDGLTITNEVDCAAEGQICLDASCVNLRCVPSATYCEGETIRQCAGDGLSSTLVENCSAGEFCDDSTVSCLPQVCVPDLPFCNGDRAQVCNPRGSGALDAGVNCAATTGMRCSSGECTCQANRLDCDGSASTGCEISGSTDVDNCGNCGAICSSNHIPARSCSASTCNGACESGYADCNADKGSDGCETYVNGDTQSCGGCGRVCSSNHVSVSCTGGSCDGACSAGYADCNSNKQTDGCETETLANPNACGACAQPCSTNHMQTRTCGGGACNGTCAAGFDDCNGNKLTDGCEADLRFGEQHCGACGQTCTGGDACVNGSCQVCNDTVLLLGDGSSSNVTLETLLENAGMVVTRVDPGISTFIGSPNPSEFGVVAMPVGLAYAGMPDTGQTAIVAAQAAGTGVVFTEWASFSASYGYWNAGLEALVLSSFGTYIAPQAVTYTLTSAGHPIWDGLPTTFTISETPSHVMGTVINGGTKIADCVQCSGAGVIVRDNGGGRIVEITHSASYDDTGWVNDPYLGPMFVNAVRWATGCF